jgi:hypothetical protein
LIPVFIPSPSHCQHKVERERHERTGLLATPVDNEGNGGKGCEEVAQRKGKERTEGGNEVNVFEVEQGCLAVTVISLLLNDNDLMERFSLV